MIDLSRYQGINQFGRAYQIMLENDAHADGSVDRVLAERMIRLCTETADYLYREYTPLNPGYQKGARPELEYYANRAIAGCGSDEEKIAGIAGFCHDLSAKVADEDLDSMIIGGTEEQIIHRGSDWCTDIARAGCALCQVVDIPARMVMLFDIDQAYSGHVIIEAYRNNSWGAVDTSTVLIYRGKSGKPVSIWELKNNPELVKANWRNSAIYTTEGMFKGTAISNYFVREWKNYNYQVNHINSYYRSILEMSVKGWPGGLRWLHGENV